MKALMIIDFKMKFEAMSSRENTLQHFGKRGIGWHGCALIYYVYKVVTDENNVVQTDTGGNDIYEAKKHIVYINQILEDCNKQDGATVLSLLEAALLVINDELPFIRNIIIQSNNANMYQNPHVVFGIYMLNCKYKNKVFVSEFIHTKTQDGKTLLDAHFASTNKHLKSFMLVWKKKSSYQNTNTVGTSLRIIFQWWGSKLNCSIDQNKHRPNEIFGSLFGSIMQKSTRILFSC